ncbi:MAG: nucleotidyl transferase [Alphaproteobacteria bacterium]|nr:nucleotidyl transferase [Alphaproteobacteria bacterium]|tara:strand:+ start:72 stop:818 length:747 start_codon:yes stop_codon:yes gene_type:complete
MTEIIDTAFILAAGFGKRLRPYTDTLPKPMVPVAGKAVIDHILDKLVKSGVKRAVVNLHHKGEVLKNHLSKRQDIDVIFSEEEELLETGGGIQHGLHLVGDKPFFIVNGDAFWDDAQGDTAFTRLSNMWNNSEDQIDLILLLQPVSKMTLTKGVGDYDFVEDNKGRIVRDRSQKGQYMFAGVRLCHPRLFEGAPGGRYSFLQLMDKADEAQKLYGLEHKGDWHHISTPEELKAVEEYYALGKKNGTEG